MEPRSNITEPALVMPGVPKGTILPEIMRRPASAAVTVAENSSFICIPIWS